jgi:hypothetical protein
MTFHSLLQARVPCSRPRSCSVAHGHADCQNKNSEKTKPCSGRSQPLAIPRSNHTGNYASPSRRSMGQFQSHHHVNEWMTASCMSRLLTRHCSVTRTGGIPCSLWEPSPAFCYELTVAFDFFFYLSPRWLSTQCTPAGALTCGRPNRTHFGREERYGNSYELVSHACRSGRAVMLMSDWPGSVA